MNSKNTQDGYYQGVQMVSYDLVKELVIALVAIGVAVLGLAFLLSSPDLPAVTIQSWATADPVDFATTATAELSGTSASAQYGPPYTDGSDSVQAIGPLSPQRIAGDALHLDTVDQFVLGPLAVAYPGDATVTAAVNTFKAASSDDKAAWLTAYSQALGNADVKDGSVVVAAGAYGPVPAIVDHLLSIARSGNLDGILLRSPYFYETNYSAPLLFIGDGGYLEGLASGQHLLGDQWGMMNETGSYPGQAWLAPVSFLYQVPPFNTSASADLLILVAASLMGLLLAFCPFIPILRDIPRWIPIHRLIWRHAELSDEE